MNVFDFAMDIERSGSRFYRQLAERAEREGVKTIFTMMAKDEELLLERFRAMKSSTMTGDSSALEYVENIFEKSVDAAEALELEDDLEAYSYVMRVEENICRLYEEAAERESNAEAKKQLLRIAKEEHRELDSLRKTYDFVNAPNEYLAWGEFSNQGEFHNFGRDED